MTVPSYSDQRLTKLRYELKRSVADFELLQVVVKRMVRQSNDNIDSLFREYLQRAQQLGIYTPGNGPACACPGPMPGEKYCPCKKNQLATIKCLIETGKLEL